MMPTMSSIKPMPKTPAARIQQGLTLIESLIAALLLAILFLGLAYVLSRGIVSHRYTVVQSLALQEVRENLQQQGIYDICVDGEAAAALTSLPNNVNVEVSCTTSDVTVDLPGLERTLETHELSLATAENNTTESLFGGNGSVLFAEN